MSLLSVAFVLGKDKTVEEKTNDQAAFAEQIGAGETFKSPVIGQMISLSEVKMIFFLQKGHGRRNCHCPFRRSALRTSRW
ncbi:hypothetical protein ACEQPO_29710 [Bacillus sp. SL00103]